MELLSRIPRISEIVPVYAVIVLLVYGWTTVAFLWKLPAWLHFLLPGEILGIYSYSLITNLAESLIILALLLAACALLPQAWLRNRFGLRGPVAVISILGGLMLLLAYHADAGTEQTGPAPSWVLAGAFAVLSLWLLDLSSRKLPAFGAALLWFSKQATIFLYILLPLSLLALVVAIGRNLA